MDKTPYPMESVPLIQPAAASANGSHSLSPQPSDMDMPTSAGGGGGGTNGVNGQREPAGFCRRLSACLWFPCNLYKVRSEEQTRKLQQELNEGWKRSEEKILADLDKEEEQLAPEMAAAEYHKSKGDVAALAKALSAVSKRNTIIYDLSRELENIEIAQRVQRQFEREKDKSQLDRKAIVFFKRAGNNNTHSRELNEQIFRMQTTSLTKTMEEEQRRAALTNLSSADSKISSSDSDVFMREAKRLIASQSSSATQLPVQRPAEMRQQQQQQQPPRPSLDVKDAKQVPARRPTLQPLAQQQQRPVLAATSATNGKVLPLPLQPTPSAPVSSKTVTGSVNNSVQQQPSKPKPAAAAAYSQVSVW